MSGPFQEMQRRQRQLDRKRRLAEKRATKAALRMAKRELRREEKHVGHVSDTDPTEGMKEAAE